MFKVNYKNTPFSSVSVVDFEQVNVLGCGPTWLNRVIIMSFTVIIIAKVIRKKKILLLINYMRNYTVILKNATFFSELLIFHKRSNCKDISENIK